VRLGAPLRGQPRRDTRLAILAAHHRVAALVETDHPIETPRSGFEKENVAPPDLEFRRAGYILRDVAHPASQVAGEDCRAGRALERLFHLEPGFGEYQVAPGVPVRDLLRGGRQDDKSGAGALLLERHVQHGGRAQRNARKKGPHKSGCQSPAGIISKRRFH